MTEEEARAWLDERFGQAKLQKLEAFADCLRTEAAQQSLIARSTFETIWSRHIVDSAQLALIPVESGPWLDIGSGGGLPGLVLAILRENTVTMMEPRRKRVEFLNAVIERLQLRNARTVFGKVQHVNEPMAVISARAVAPVVDIFAWTEKSVSRETTYILPHGQTWRSELDVAERTWQGRFHVERSLTNPDAGIIIAREVRRR